MWQEAKTVSAVQRQRESVLSAGQLGTDKNKSQKDRTATLEGDRQEVRPMANGPAQKQSWCRPVCSGHNPGPVPQSQPFRAPGMCPLEVQAGQLSVENKLLPCFQALWQRDYNPWYTHPHTPHPEPYSPFHPVFRPLPLCVNLLTCQKGKCGGFTV